MGLFDLFKKKKKQEISKEDMKFHEDFIKAKRYAQLNNCDLTTAYKKLKLGDYADGKSKLSKD